VSASTRALTLKQLAVAAARACQAAGARPRRLGDAQVCGGLSGGQDEEVRDAERTGDVDKVLQLVALGLLWGPPPVRLLLRLPVQVRRQAAAWQSHSSGSGTPACPSQSTPSYVQQLRHSKTARAQWAWPGPCSKQRGSAHPQVGGRVGLHDFAQVRLQGLEDELHGQGATGATTGARHSWPAGNRLSHFLFPELM